MLKTKKWILFFLIAAVMLLSAFAFMGFSTNVSAYAESDLWNSRTIYLYITVV